MAINLNRYKLKKMINLAHYENGRGESDKEICRYYQSDYITIEIIKTVFTMTVGFVLVLGIAAVGNIEFLMENINKIDIVRAVSLILIVYIILLGVYIALTWWIAHKRHIRARRSIRAFEKNLDELLGSLRQEEEVRAKEKEN